MNGDPLKLQNGNGNGVIDTSEAFKVVAMPKADRRCESTGLEIPTWLRRYKSITLEEVAQAQVK